MSARKSSSAYDDFGLDGPSVRGPVAEPVEGDAQDVLGLRRVRVRDLGDADDERDHLADRDVVADDARLLGPREQRLAGLVQGAAAGLEELRVLVEVVDELGSEGLLGRDVADHALQPALQVMPGVGAVEARRPTALTSRTSST